ncbi:hypothetical protein E4U32_004619 [Claviceps aff. humidiphila group G2b]|nr:hypothetical protein E4U32_004619 [Claviceps aff. humidiphila group G2b]
MAPRINGDEEEKQPPPLEHLAEVKPVSEEGFTVIPDVTWNQVGALEVARKQLQTSIIEPIKRLALHEELEISPSAASSSDLINGPELLNKYVRDLFERARSSKPCIVFFGEMDLIVPPRANATTESGAGVVHALLAELDDTSNRSGIYVIGNTSHPELINEAFLRPDRLGQIFIDLPTPSERVEIPQAIYRTPERI